MRYFYPKLGRHKVNLSQQPSFLLLLFRDFSAFGLEMTRRLSSYILINEIRN
jgi:hypothetical protein